MYTGATTALSTMGILGGWAEDKGMLLRRHLRMRHPLGHLRMPRSSPTVANEMSDMTLGMMIVDGSPLLCSCKTPG